MAEYLTYDETKALERSIRLKKKANEIYRKFLLGVKLRVKDYRNGKFEVWSDSHNSKYIYINDRGEFVFECDFLHEDYVVVVTPSKIYEALSSEYRGLNHLEAFVNRKQI